MLSSFRILEIMQQGVALLDADLRVVIFNDRIGKLLRAPKGAIDVGVSATRIAAQIPILGRTQQSDGSQGSWLTHLLTCSTLFYQEISVGDRIVSLTSTPVDDGGWLVSCDDISALASIRKDMANQNRRFDAALANMPHGLCMFDADKSLLLCNAGYCRLYDLPETLTRPGTPLWQILDYRQTAGNAQVQQEAYFDVVVEAALKGSAASENIALMDGRVIKITHNPMENGGYVATHEDVTQFVRAEEQIKHMAGHDPLTGLPNRTLLRERLEKKLALGNGNKRSALLCLDLDHFRHANDTLGHAVGDLLLKPVTDRLKTCLGESDSIARLGGDEFIVIQEEVQTKERAAALAQRLVNAIGETFVVEGQPVQIGVSIGIAIAPDDGETADAVLKNADTALYKAKTDGRGTYCFFEPAMDAGIPKLTG